MPPFWTRFFLGQLRFHKLNSTGFLGDLLWVENSRFLISVQSRGETCTKSPGVSRSFTPIFVLHAFPYEPVGFIMLGSILFKFSTHLLCTSLF